MSFKKLVLENIVSRGFQAVVTFLVSFVIARLFEAEASGILFYWTTIFAFVILISSFSINDGIKYHYARQSISKKSAVLMAFINTFILSCISFLVLLFLIKDQIPPAFSRSEFIIYAVVFNVGNFLISIFQALFQADKNFKTPAIIQSLTGIALIFIAYIGFNVYDDKAVFIYNFSKIYLASFLFTGIILVVLYIAKAEFRFNIGKFESTDYKKVLKYSATAFISNIIIFLIFRLDYWFVHQYCSENDLGNYIQVNKLSTLFFMIPTMIATNIFFLATYEQDHQKVTYYLEKISRIVATLFFPFVLLLLIFGKYIFPFLFGFSYASMHIIFSISSVGILLFLISIPFGNLFAGKNKMIINIIAESLGILIIVIGNFIFTPRYGVEAAATVSSLAYSVQAIFLIYTYKKHYGIRLKNMFFLKKNDWQLFSQILKRNNKR